MKRINILTLYRKWVKWGVIPLFLFSIWAAGSVYESIRVDTSFTVITQNFNRSNFNIYNTDELLKGHKIEASFQPNYNYLGIVAVRFNTFMRINNDSVIFKIKESNNRKWLYEGTYRVNQFQPHGLFTFGFPVIYDSKGKTYIIEIESVKGKKRDAVALS